MSDFSSKRGQALAACEKAINGIEDGIITVSGALLLCKKIARLLNDQEGMIWLDYEMNGYPSIDGHILSEAWQVGARHGRSYPSKDENGKRLDLIFTELCGELEANTQSFKSALNNYSTQGFSVAGDYAALATSNLTYAVSAGTNNLLRNIKIAEKRLEILKSQYYDYALKWQIELSFGNVSKSIFADYQERVDSYFARLPVTTLQKLNAIEDMMQDDNPERYAQVLTSCRRLWSEIARLLFNEAFPNYQGSKYKTVSGKEIDISGDHDNNKLSAVIESLQSKSTKNTLVGSTMIYLVDWMEQINSRQSAGVHSDVTKEEAEQCIIHTYIALGDILRLKNEVLL